MLQFTCILYVLFRNRLIPEDEIAKKVDHGGGVGIYIIYTYIYANIYAYIQICMITNNNNTITKSMFC